MREYVFCVDNLIFVSSKSVLDFIFLRVVESRQSCKLPAKRRVSEQVFRMPQRIFIRKKSVSEYIISNFPNSKRKPHSFFKNLTVREQVFILTVFHELWLCVRVHFL